MRPCLSSPDPPMPLWYAALLGVVQGLTEFLPVSSTAHVRLLPALLGQPDPGAATTAVLQLGTLLAVFVYFRRELLAMTRAVFIERSGPDAALAVQIVLGTLPIGVLGILLKPYIVGPLRSLWVIAAALIVVGLVMHAADRLGQQSRGIRDLGVRDALLIGLAQACALVPGVSRSGSTLSAALGLGLKREDAARFSFLLSIPAVSAAGLFEMKDAVHELGREALPALAVGTGVSFVVGYAAIAWLIQFLGTRSTLPFVVYRVLVGLGIALGLWMGWLSP